MEGWLDGSRACHHCPSLGVPGFKGFLRSPATWMEAQSPRQRPILDPPSPVIGSQASQISTHATTACSGLLSALDPTRLTPPQEPESLQQRAAPSTTFPPSNDGTALQLFAAAHRLPGHIGSHDFVSHIRPGNGDVFPSALGPIPLRFFGRPPYTSRCCRRPLPYYWTSTVWVPGLLISLRLVHGGVPAGTLPRPPPPWASRLAERLEVWTGEPVDRGLSVLPGTVAQNWTDVPGLPPFISYSLNTNLPLLPAWICQRHTDRARVQQSVSGSQK